MSPESMWGELPLTSETKPPIVFLREQATTLKTATNGLLYGEVRAHQQGTSLSASLDVVAPALDGYRYEIVSIAHGITFYPVTLVNPLLGQRTQCNDEETYLARLRTHLSSNEVHRILGALIAQSKTGWGGLKAETNTNDDAKE